MIRNENAEMSHNYQEKLTEIDVLKAEIQRLVKVEEENKILRLVFSSTELFAQFEIFKNFCSVFGFENPTKGEKRKDSKQK